MLSCIRSFISKVVEVGLYLIMYHELFELLVLSIIWYFRFLFHRKTDPGLVQTHADFSGKTLQDQVRPEYPISHSKEEMATAEFRLPEGLHCPTHLYCRNHTGIDFLQSYYMDRHL